MMQCFIVTSILIIFIANIIHKKQDILLPENLFVIVLLSTYDIACLKLSNLQHNYNLTFTVLIIILAFSFWFGAHIKISSKNESFKYDYYPKRLKQVIYILFIIVVGAFIITWIKLGAPPLISKTERFNYYLPIIGLLYLMIDLLSFLLIFDIFNGKCMKKKAYIMLLVILAMIILNSNKFQIIYLILQNIIIYNILKKKINIWTLVKVGILSLIIFIIYYMYVYNGVYISNDEMYEVNQMNFSKKFSLLTNPYLYISFNYENLFNYINLDYKSWGFGFYTFREIIESFNLTNFITNGNIEFINQWNNNLQYSWLTTGTIFKEFYMDFGIIGSIILTILLGVFCKNSYKKCYEQRSIFYLYLYSTNIVSIFICFFTNNFVSINYLINLICAYIIDKYCFKKNN